MCVSSLRRLPGGEGRGARRGRAAGEEAVTCSGVCEPVRVVTTDPDVDCVLKSSALSPDFREGVYG